MTRFSTLSVILVAISIGPSVVAQSVLHEWTSPQPQPEGLFGYDVAITDDVDGDGVQDLLVGAPGENADGAPERSGRAYVISTATGAQIYAFDTPSGVQHGSFGESVASVPDLDGDDLDDYAVSALHERSANGEPRAGRVHVFSSQSGELLYSLNSPHPSSNGQFGISVAGLADADGDGSGDIAVGAWLEMINPWDGIKSGRAYLFSGATGAVHLEFVSPSCGFLCNFGRDVASIGDIDSDGRSDLVISASGEGPSSSGAIHAFSGAHGTRRYSVRMGTYYQQFGGAIDVLGDLDGDGFTDYAVSKRGDTNVLSGATGALIERIAAPPGIDNYFTAEPTGDIDGDGIPDAAFGLRDDRRVLSGATWETLVEDFAFSRIAGGIDITGNGMPEVIAGDPVRGVVQIVGAFPVSGEASPRHPTFVRAAPNPSSTSASIRFGTSEPGPVRVTVHDVLGREVSVLADGARRAGEQTLDLDVSAWAPGIYLVRLATADGVQTTRLTVAR